MSEPGRDVSDVLIDTLNRAAAGAPPPPADLYRSVTAGYTRRRRAGVVAAATVLALLVGLAGLVTVTREEPAPVARVVEELSADAVRTLPRTIEGRRYLVDAVLSDGRVVVQTPVHTIGRAEIRLFDADGRGTPRLVVGYESTFAEPVYLQVVRANDEWLTWYVNRPRGTVEIWTLRWDENRPRRVAEVRDALGEFSLTLVDDRVVYGPTKEGVLSVPARGGTSTVLPGTAGHYTVLWPWLVTNPGSDPPNYTRDRPTLRNVETGETLTAVFTPTGWRDACGPVWCVGQGWDGAHLTAVRVDGSDPTVLTGLRTDVVALTPVRNRYLPLIRTEPAPDGSQQLAVADLGSGRVVDVGRVANDPGELVLTTVNDGVFSWSGADGMKVLDLRRFD
ncbi:hypothetical protein [Cryptosporangium japonicum]|uniref:WD40 repeat domain-containing protein n=1 Tax=Cryptosporangium japonicum TaxID=80872 RepID=A0ABN0UBV8_9ACTN